MLNDSIDSYLQLAMFLFVSFLEITSHDLINKLECTICERCFVLSVNIKHEHTT